MANKTLSLNLRANLTTNGVQIHLWHGAAVNTEPSSMWYLRHAEGAALNHPDVGRAPANSYSRV